MKTIKNYILNKKTIAILLILIIILTNISPVFAVSGSGSFVGGQFASYIFTNDSGSSADYGVLIRKLVNYSTGEQMTTFCAENGTNFSTGTIYAGEYYNPQNENLKRACKVAYFGWYSKYGDYVVDGGISATAKQDYVFTQQYIWETLGQSNATFRNSSIQDNYISFKNNINNQINNMQTRPSFDATTITIDAGETKVLTDTNGVLANYYSIDSSRDNIRFQHNEGENTLTITASENCEIENLSISDGTFQSWGMIKSASQDNDTSIYFSFSNRVQNQLYSLHYNDPVSMAINLEINLTGRLELTKLDTNDNLIDGSIFNITGPNDYNNDVTVTNGRIVVENLKKGTYYIKEKSAPNGYLINEETYEVEIRPNATTTQTIINEKPTGTFTLTKTNEKGTINLEGVTYKIWNEDKSYNQTFKTNKDGIIEVSKLELGKYYYQEIQTIEGYLIDNTIYEFTLEYKDQYTSVVYASTEKTNSEPTGTFTLTKKNAENTINLSGTKYRIWNDSGYNKEFITDDNGEIEVSGLKLGEYKYQEIEATYGYLLDTNIYTFELKYKDQNTKVVYANAIKTNEEPTGTFTLIKKNIDGTKNIQGTKYRVWNNNGYEKVFTTDENGKIEITGLKLGQYKYQEIQASTGYIIDNNIYTFELKYKDQNTRVIYANATKTNEEAIGTFTLIKKNTDETKNIEGTKYKIWNDNGYEKEFTTDKNGKIEVTRLKLGKYYYQEIQASTGYIIDNKIYTFELKYKDQNTKVVYVSATRTNEETTGTFTLIKKNAENTINLSETKYKIWNDDGYENEFTTDKNGKIEITGLKLGKYYYQEIQATYGYVLDTNIYTFELKYKDQNTKVVYADATRTNEETTGTFTLTKKNEDSSANLKGTIYRIWNNEKNYDKTFETDINGQIKITGLKLGTYNYQEIKAIDGYLIDSKVYTFELKYKDQYTPIVYSNVEKTNIEPTGTISIIKRDSEKDNIPQGDAEFTNAKYELYAIEDIYNKARTKKFYNNGDLVATRIMNEEGKTEDITNLPLGKYKVKEIVSSLGYLLDNKEYEVNLKYKDQNTSVISETVISYEIVKKMQVHIFKSGMKENSGLVAGLEGAEFTIKLNSDVERAYSLGYTYEEIFNGINEFGNKVQVNKTRVNEAQLIAPTYEIIKTDSEGNAYTDNKLPYGKYIVKETHTPEDYESAIDFTFSITQDESEIEEISKKVKHLVVNNEPLETYIKIVKKDLKTGKTVTLNSATFEIKATKDIYDGGKLIYKKGEPIKQKVGSTTYSTFTTNADNIVVPNNSYYTENDDKGTTVTPLKLELGSYEIIEIKTPKGFLQLENPVIFKVNGIRDYDKDQDGDCIKEVVIKNEQPTGSLIIDKSIALRENANTSLVDTSDLSGIKFKLTAKENIIDYSDGSVIYKKGQEVKTYNLDKKGDLKVEKLPMGKYELQEVKVIDGLVLNDTIYDVEFIKQDDVTKVYTEIRDIVNDTTIVEFSKTDIIGEKELEGAKLTVLDKDGNVIDSWTSTDKTHKIEGLVAGKSYILREEIAPEGFVRATNIEFKVENTKEIQKVTMIDKIVDMTKNNIAGDEVEGAKMQVFDKDGNIVDEWISGKEAHRIKNLAEGEKYTLHEETAPDGYVVATDVEFEVTTDKETQHEEMIDKIVNMSKVDVAGEEIEGAKIQVFDKNGNIVDEWKSGKEPHIINNLKENETYILHEEIAPDGYVKATDIEFTVTTNKETQHEEIIDKIVNMSKVDVAGKEIEGAKIQVFDKDNNLVDEWVSSKEPHIIKNLVEGEKYILHEEIAPDGYVKATDIEFEVTMEKENQKIVMIDKIIDVTKTDLTNGEELEGAELVVTDEEGNVIDKWISSKEPHHITGLEEGKKYTLTEITAPYGYEIAESIEFEVSLDKENQLIEMKDSPILKSVRVEKLDKDTKEHIKSNKFVFGIYEDEACTQLIKEAGANEFEGTTLFDDLRYGTYYIKEIKAPIGYKLSEQVVKVEINDKGVFADDVSLEEKDGIYSFEYYNSLLPYIQTGNEMNYPLLFSLMGLFLIGITIGICIIKRKNRKND